MKTQQQKAAEMLRDAGYARGGPPRIAYRKGDMDAETDANPAATEGKPTVDVVLAIGKGKGGANQGMPGMPPADDGEPMSRRGRLRNGGRYAKGGAITEAQFENSKFDDDTGVKEGSPADKKLDAKQMAKMKKSGKFANGGKVGNDMSTSTKPPGGIADTAAVAATKGDEIDNPSTGKMEQTGSSVPRDQGTRTVSMKGGAGSGLGRIEKSRMAG